MIAWKVISSPEQADSNEGERGTGIIRSERSTDEEES